MSSIMVMAAEAAWAAGLSGQTIDTGILGTVRDPGAASCDGDAPCAALRPVR